MNFRLLISLIAAAVAEPEIPGPLPAFTALRTAIVQVGQIGSPHRWSGTGFFLDDRCTVATAKHVLQGIDKKKLGIRFTSSEDTGTSWTAPAVVLDEDLLGDLAFLRPMKRELRCPPREFHHFPIYREPHTRDLAGEEIFILGHPVLATGQHLDMVVIRKGIIASAEIKWSVASDHPMLLLDLQGAPGFSGGPVVLARTREVVGVVYGPGPTSRLAGFEWATPLTFSRFERIPQQ